MYMVYTSGPYFVDMPLPSPFKFKLGFVVTWFSIFVLFFESLLNRTLDHFSITYWNTQEQNTVQQPAVPHNTHESIDVDALILLHKNWFII